MFLTINITPPGEPPVGEGSFTIGFSRDQTNVISGEVIGIHVVPGSETGFGSLDVYRDVNWVIHLDDDTGEFEIGSPPWGNITARSVPGRTACKAWFTASGTKTITVSAYGAGNVLLAQETATVTITHPNDYAWDVTIYHDSSGVFSGMPADNGTTIRRTSTHADLVGITSLYTTGDDVRVIVKDNDTLSLNQSSTIPIRNNGSGRVYFQNQSLGAAGTLAVWTDTTNDAPTFTEGSTATDRPLATTFIGLDFRGLYDPVGAALGDDAVAFYVSSFIDEVGGHDAHWTFARCKVSGFYNMSTSGGPNASTAGTGIAGKYIYDSEIRDMYDYGIFHGAGQVWFGANGNTILPNPRTTTGDPKDPTDVYADHAISGRIQNPIFFSIVNNWGAGAAGWTGTGPDHAFQPAWRIVPDASQCEGTYMLNKTAGRRSIHIHDPNGQYVTEPHGIVIEHNLSVGIRQGQMLFESQVGAVYARNNIQWFPDIWSEAIADNGIQIARYERDTSSAAMVRESYVEFNTIISDRNTQGGTGSYTPILLVDWTGAAVNQTNNWVEIPNHSNAGSYPSEGTPSRADLFRPINGSSVIDDITTGYRPNLDFGRNQRPANGSGSTNKGAWDVSVASDAGVSAPVNVTPPTITQNVHGDYILTGDVWTGIDDNVHLGPLGEFLWVPTWFVNGVEAGNQATRFDPVLNGVNGSGSTLTANIRFVGLGGQTPVVATASNSVTL